MGHRGSQSVDHGEPIRTPAGTGRFGHPIGTGPIWADVGNAGPAAGTQGTGTTDGSGVVTQDGTGSR